MHPLQIPYNKVCEMLSVSRETLRILMRRDPSFPRAIKYGESRQAPVFFSYDELVAWHNKRKVQS
nr:transcriptional regulator [Acinetobacter indicus]